MYLCMYFKLYVYATVSYSLPYTLQCLLGKKASTSLSSKSKGKKDELQAEKKSKVDRPAKGFHRGL